ncbi:hypothetical protein MHYP_G00291430 [Metynnis hypsauchen]
MRLGDSQFHQDLHTPVLLAHIVTPGSYNPHCKEIQGSVVKDQERSSGNAEVWSFWKVLSCVRSYLQVNFTSQMCLSRCNLI